MISKCRIRDCNVEHPAGWHEREDSDRVRRRIIDLVPELKALFYEQGKVDRPLTISDVLRAIEKRHAGQIILEQIALYGEQFHFIARGIESGHVKNAYWNLTTDYDNQTDEVKAFVGKLIGV